jgi:uncharacterized membrane protein YphA (DoxX/SURF4 family)
MITIPIRVRRGAAWLLGVYLAYLYVRMGWGKFDGRGWWATAFAEWGYPASLRVVVGVVEVAAGAALLLPRLASYGALALCVVMLGAGWTLALFYRWGDLGWVALYFLGLVWIAREWWDVRLQGPDERADGFIRIAPRAADRQR